MGEEIDSTVDSTSKLQKEILALSGVDIMKNATEFKSTYAILQEISKVWDDLTDVNRATILEDLFGKRQANVGASILTNFDSAEKALATSQNSAGSALKEHSIWLNSIEAKQQQFTAQWQVLSSTLINSELIKGAVDTGSGLLGFLTQSIEMLGAFPTLAAVAIGAVSGFSNRGIFSLRDKSGNLSGKGFNFSLFGLNDSSEKKDAGIFSDIAKMYERGAVSSKEFEGAFNKLSDAGKNTAQTIIHNKQASEQVSEGFLNASQSANKLGISSKVAAIGMKALSMAANMAIGFLIAKGIELAVTAIDNIIHKAEKLQEAADEAKQSIEGINSDYQSKADLVEKDAEAYEKLSQGVDKLTGKNLSLSTEDYEQFLSISNELADVFPDLVVGYDSQGNALLDLSGNADTVTSSLQQLLKVERDLADQKIIEESGKIWENVNYKNSDTAIKDKILKDKEFKEFVKSFKLEKSDENGATFSSDWDIHSDYGKAQALREKFASEFGVDDKEVGTYITELIDEMFGGNEDTFATRMNPNAGTLDILSKLPNNFDTNKYFSNALQKISEQYSAEVNQNYSELNDLLLATLRQEFQFELDGMSDKQQANICLFLFRNINIIIFFLIFDTFVILQLRIAIIY